MKRYVWEVQQLCNTPRGLEWLNLWSTETADASIPLTFATEEEARAEMQVHLDDAFEEVSVPIDLSTVRVERVEAPQLYPIGHAFKCRVGLEVRDFLITYAFMSDNGWRYHMGLDMAPANYPIPQSFGSAPTHILNGRQYCDWASVDEYQLLTISIPKAGDPPIYMLARGHGDFKEWFNTELGWVNRQHATPFTTQEKVKYENKNVLPLTAYWEQVK